MDADQVGGIEVFDTREHLDAFRESALTESIARAYRFSDGPEIRAFDVLLSVRGPATA